MRAGGKRGEREKSALDRHFGGRRYGEFARAKRIHDRLGRRQIYPEFPCRISRGPSSDAVIRTTVLSVAGMGEKKMICDEVIYFIYIYIVCFFLARSRVRVLELEFIPRWTWNDSNRINRICM